MRHLKILIKCILCNQVINDTVFSKVLCNDCIRDGDARRGIERLGVHPDEDDYVCGI